MMGRQRQTGDRRREEDAEETEPTTETGQSLPEPGVLLETGTEETQSYPLGDEETLEQVSAEDNADVVLDEMAEYTEDPEILQDFAERQQMPLDEQGLRRRLREHHSETPQLSGGDLDAAWDQGEDVGEETVSAEPVPDEDIVDEIGRAAGLTYEDDETLDFVDKVWKRDEERWELNLASAEDEVSTEDEASGGVEASVDNEVSNDQDDELESDK